MWACIGKLGARAQVLVLLSLLVLSVTWACDFSSLPHGSMLSKAPSSLGRVGQAWAQDRSG